MSLSHTALSLAFLFIAGLAQADDYTRLGMGRIVNNDIIGDLQDRWRTGSATGSHVFGRDPWTGGLPMLPGELLEFRLHGEIIGPDDLNAPAPRDRPFAGIWALGVHTHYRFGDADIAVGADLVATGPQTGLERLQSNLHDILGMPRASGAVRRAQIGDDFHLSPVVEFAKTYPVAGSGIWARPFLEVRGGVETIYRAGVDFRLGPIGGQELWVRDQVTGQRYRVVTRDTRGIAWVFGWDHARVTETALLPPGRGYRPTNTRTRLRAGMHWQGETGALFYGVTWLSREFIGQPEGQVVGSLRLDFSF